MDWLMMLLGLVLLVVGAEALVRGAVGIAMLARITPVVIGLTIVAAGTSMPELVVSVQAALAGSPGLAMGNVVGSNLFNIGVVLGVAALVRPLRILGNTVRMEWPIMMLASLQLLMLARDGTLDRLEGGFLLTAMVAFIAYGVHVGRTATPEEEDEFASLVAPTKERPPKTALAVHLLSVAAGVALLAFGATALVDGAVAVASGLGVSETVIGLTIVAAGTSAPELVTSVVAVYRGQDDIAVGNVIGSCIFNILAILGATALIEPLTVPVEVLDRDIWWMVVASLLLFPIMKSGMRVSRLEGALLFTGFATYLGVLVASV